MAIPLAENIDWVGVVDWGLTHFHGHELSTHRGSTYNAYLIRDEKTALVDTVWDPYTDEFLDGLDDVIDPGDIDYVIANHAEPDHSGALPALMRACTNATLVTSKRGAQSIEGHYHGGWDIHAVGSGDTVELGRRTLTFVEAPMLHWPDSMFTYCSPDAILMPNDAFGQHYATAWRFNDQVEQDELYQEALKYYANILTPFSERVIAKIDELVEMDIPVKMIAPSHGVIWRDEPMQIVAQYKQWAQQKGQKRAAILYDTMWQATRRMAEAIGDGLRDEGVDFKLFHMAASDRNDVITEIFQSKAVIVGSPTLNNGVLPTISPILEDLRGLGFANKIGAAFGSYGWSGEALKYIQGHLEECKIQQVAEGVQAKWQPKAEDLENCRAMGRTVGQAVCKQLG